MKLVVLTSRGPQHRFVARVLADAFPESLAAIIVADPPRRAPWRRIQSYLRRYTAPQLFSRIVAKVADRVTGASAMRDRQVADHLFPDGDDGCMPRQDLVQRVPSHNAAACLSLLDSLAPDVIAVYGTGVIRDSVIQRASLGIVNLHTGISPRYRGADSVFWALHNGEPEWIGSTVHALDAKLDAGPIFATRTVPLDPDDNEGTLFAKCVEIGSALYVDVVRGLCDGTATPVPQTLSEGREYRFVDRTFGAERRLVKALREGLLRSHPS